MRTISASCFSLNLRIFPIVFFFVFEKNNYASQITKRSATKTKQKVKCMRNKLFYAKMQLLDTWFHTCLLQFRHSIYDGLGPMLIESSIFRLHHCWFVDQYCWLLIKYCCARPMFAKIHIIRFPQPNSGKCSLETKSVWLVSNIFVTYLYVYIDACICFL